MLFHLKRKEKEESHAFRRHGMTLERSRLRNTPQILLFSDCLEKGKRSAASSTESGHSRDDLTQRD